MRPSTRTFLASAGFVITAVMGGALREWLVPKGPDDRYHLVPIIIVGVLVLLAIGVAWIRLQLDMRERRRRPKPLDFG